MSITSANAVLMLTIPGVFNTPQQVQGFANEEAFEIPELETAETMMGVDGTLTGGFVFNPVDQNITLMGDSPSNILFDTWYQAKLTIVEEITATGQIILTSTGRQYSFQKGFLVNWKPAPDSRKVLQPRRHTVRWERIFPANI